MSDLMNKTKACLEFLAQVQPDTGKHSGQTDDRRFREWQKAVYDDPDFLYLGDFFTIYSECRGKAPNELSKEKARACITFLVRQMRFGYAPYPFLVEGELLGLLRRWTELEEKDR